MNLWCVYIYILYIYIHIGVSKNSGTPKWMVYNGSKPYDKIDNLGGPPLFFGNTYIYIYILETPIYIYIFGNTYIYIYVYIFLETPIYIFSSLLNFVFSPELSTAPNLKAPPRLLRCLAHGCC